MATKLTAPWPPALLLLIAVTALTAPRGAAAATLTAYSLYNTSTCSGAPKQLAYLAAADAASCVANATCGPAGGAYENYFVTSECIQDAAAYAYTPKKYGGAPFVSVSVFSKPDCAPESFMVAAVDLADGECVVDKSGSAGAVATLDGGAGAFTLKEYNATDCSGVPHKVSKVATKNKGACQDGFVFFTSSAGAPRRAVAALAAAAALLALVLVL